MGMGKFRLIGHVWRKLWLLCFYVWFTFMGCISLEEIFLKLFWWLVSKIIPSVPINEREMKSERSHSSLGHCVIHMKITRLSSQISISLFLSAREQTKKIYNLNKAKGLWKKKLETRRYRKWNHKRHKTNIKYNEDES